MSAASPVRSSSGCSGRRPAAAIYPPPLQRLALSGDSVDVVQPSELRGSGRACHRNGRAPVTWAFVVSQMCESLVLGRPLMPMSGPQSGEVRSRGCGQTCRGECAGESYEGRAAVGSSACAARRARIGSVRSPGRRRGPRAPDRFSGFGSRAYQPRVPIHRRCMKTSRPRRGGSVCLGLARVPAACGCPVFQPALLILNARGSR